MKKHLLLWIILLGLLAGFGIGLGWWFSQPHTAEAQFAQALKLEGQLQAKAATQSLTELRPLFDQTIQSFSAVEKHYGKSPSAAQAWQHIAGLHEQIAKQDDQALAALDHLVTDYPTPEFAGAALLEQARIIRRQAATGRLKDPAAAATRYRDVLAKLAAYRTRFPKEPKAAGALMEIGRIWQDGLQAPLIKAIETFEQFLHEYPADPDYPEALFRLATLMEQIKEDNRALQLYSELLDKFPKYKDADQAQLARGKLLADKLGRPEEAAKDFEQLPEKFPDSPLGEEAKARGQEAKAEGAKKASEGYAKGRYGRAPVDTLSDKPVPPDAHLRMFADQKLDVQTYDLDVNIEIGSAAGAAGEGAESAPNRLAETGTIVLVNRGTKKEELLLMLADGLEVSRVLVNGAAAKSQQDAQTWKIALAKPLDEGATATIQFACAGRFAAPRPLPGGPGGMGATAPANPAPPPATTAPATRPVSEKPGVKVHFNPQLTLGNAEEGGYALSGGPWYPSNLIGDVFQATVRFGINAPVELVATGQTLVHQPAGSASKGELGQFKFQTKSPVTGLYFVYGPFTRRQETRGGIAYTTLYRAEHAARSAEYIKAVADILDFYSSRFGPYSYEQLTIVDTPLPPFLGGVGPAGLMLLHQSMVGQNDIPTNLLAHELAHQWFGNQIPINLLTPGYNQWLSEGFATYADALYTEAREGPAALAHHMERYDQLYFTSLLMMPRMTSILGTVPGSALYRPVVYEKGAIVLHSLRKVMGDERFFALLKEYVKRYQNTPSTVDDFRKLAQETYGQDLSWFFQTWLEKTSFAHYRIAGVETGPPGTTGGTGPVVTLKIQQPENVLKMPVDITLLDAAGQRHVWPNVWIDQPEQAIKQNCPFTPTRILLDADNWILKRPGPDATWPPPATATAPAE